MVISVLIVDDEPHARRYLRDLLKYKLSVIATLVVRYIANDRYSHYH